MAGSRPVWARVRAGIGFFTPILVVIGIASLLALVATLSDTQVDASVVRTDEDTGTAGQAGAGLVNAIIFILPAIAGSFGIVYLIRKGKKRALKNVFRGLMGFATAIIVSFFIFKIYETLAEKSWYLIYTRELGTVSFINYNEWSLITYFIFGLLIGYTITSMIFSSRFTRRERNGALIAMSSLMGAFMAIILPTWTVLFLLIGLALWDIYAVFKGPIKDMVELDSGGRLMVRWDPLGDDSDDFPFENMTYDSGTWQLGIGDLVFYSVLGSHSVFYSVDYVRTEGFWMLPFFFVPVLIAILIGFAYTIYRLSRSDGASILPGLPVPMFLGVGMFCIMMAIARWLI